jgi:hypothetical protein
MSKHHLRGHKIEQLNNIWVYSDTKEPTHLNHLKRPCGNCGKDRAKEGYDGCLGTLKGVMNACCGHGVVKEAYVQYWSGDIFRGQDAINEINKLK